MRNPKISIVTCTKNREKFLKICLQSVEQQTYKNIEHIFVDGHSTDGTTKLIKAYIKRNPQLNIKLINAPPKGIANALNIGFEHTTGDIVHFLHDDDFYYDVQALERVANYFSENPKVKWIVGNCVLMFREKVIVLPLSKILKHVLKKAITVWDVISHENTFATRELYAKYGPFREDNKICVEYQIWLKALRDTEPLVVDDNFTVYLVHKDSVTSNPFNQIIGSNIENIKIWKDVKNIPIIGNYEDMYLYKKINDISNKLAEYKESFIKNMTS